MSIYKHYGALAETILEGGAYKATVFVGPNETIKATRKRYGKNKDLHKRAKQTIIVFTCGKPNYEERAFLKKAKKEGRPFPIVTARYPEKKGK